MDRLNRPLGEIKFLVGPEAGNVFYITRPSISIGRQQGNDIVTLDPTVSLNHAEIVFHNGFWTIHALSSQCKISINQQEIQHATINNHDVICLGANTVVLFLLEVNIQPTNIALPQHQPGAIPLSDAQPSPRINPPPQNADENSTSDPLRNPRDPAWQLIGIIITALSVILSIFQLPDSARIPGILIGTSGIAICFFVLIRLRRKITSIKATLQSKPFVSSSPSGAGMNVSSLPAQAAPGTPLQIEKNKLKTAGIHNMRSSLIINIVLFFVCAIMASLFVNSRALNWIYVLDFFGIVVVFIVFAIRIFRLTLNRSISIRKVLGLCIIAIVITFIVVVVTAVVTPGEVNGVYSWTFGPILAGSLAFCEEIAVLVLIGISALVRK